MNIEFAKVSGQVNPNKPSKDTNHGSHSSSHSYDHSHSKDHR